MLCHGFLIAAPPIRTYGNWVCQPRAGFALRELDMLEQYRALRPCMNTHEGWSNQCQMGSPSEIPEQRQIRSQNRDPNASTVKNQQPAQFYRRFLQNYILNHNHGGQAENYSINVPTDLHPVCELLHLRPNLLQEILHV